MGTDRYSGDRNGGHASTLTSLGTDWQPPFDKVTSVAVVAIESSSSRVVAVNLVDRGLDLPGGHTQTNDETPLDTARRECAEEVSIRIADLVLVDTVESDFYGTSPDDLTYMLIYSAEVTELLPFEANEEAVDRVLVRPSEFLEGFTGGDPKLMKRWLAEALKSRNIGWT